MAAFATLEQFEARFERALNVTEQARVTALLDDAADVIRAQVAGILDPAPSITVGVSCAMVGRVIRNPAGKRQETFGTDYAFQLDPAVASGELYLTEGEQDDVAAAVSAAGGTGGATGAFTITPVYPVVVDS